MRLTNVEGNLILIFHENYFIELDERSSIANEFQIVKANLSEACYRNGTE